MSALDSLGTRCVCSTEATRESALRELVTLRAKAALLEEVFESGRVPMDADYYRWLQKLIDIKEGRALPANETKENEAHD